MTELVQAISTVGFPIVISVILLYELRENSKQHKEETDKLSETLQNNTVVLMQLKQLLEDKTIEKEVE